MSKIKIPKDHHSTIYIFKENFRWVQVLEVVYISYNTGTRALPDIRICTRPWALRTLEHRAYNIRQCILACAITYAYIHGSVTYVNHNRCVHTYVYRNKHMLDSLYTSHKIKIFRDYNTYIAKYLHIIYMHKVLSNSYIRSLADTFKYNFNFDISLCNS